MDASRTPLLEAVLLSLVLTFARLRTVLLHSSCVPSDEADQRATL